MNQQSKFNAQRERSSTIGQELQRQIDSAYRRGWLEGSANERLLMTDGLRNLLTAFSQECEARARTQEADISMELVEPVEGGQDEPGAFSKIASKFAPASAREIQDQANALDEKPAAKEGGK